MNGPQKTISRDDLYKRVWEQPFVRLAKELGYSYADLVRICSEQQIPRPGSGYWYRLAHGGTSEQLPLPPAPTGQYNEIPRGTGNQSSEAATGEEVARADDEPTKCASSAINEASMDSRSVIPAESTARTAPPESVTFTRQELYRAIWSKPCLKLAAELGVSDVALAKTCRRMGIPRPPRGYWARIEAGEKLRRPPLPPSQNAKNETITFHVADNLARREQWAANNILTAGRDGKQVTVELPPDEAELHPLAARHRHALEKAKPGDLGFVSIRGTNLFSCQMSLALVPRFARALHALIYELEDRDYEFNPGNNDFEGLQISRDTDRVGLNWSEAKFEVEREPTDSEKRRPSWTWQLRETKAAGKLSIDISAVGLKGKRKWTEDDRRPLEEVLGIIIQKIEATFCGFEERRKREAEWARQREEDAKREGRRQAEEAERRAKEEKEKKERERIKRHEKKLDQIIALRRENLFDGAQEWTEMQVRLMFIELCENRWRQAANRKLTKAQANWIAWAKSEAEKMGPFNQGYPDPALDGNFDPSSIPVGGPYPDSRDWPERKSSRLEQVKSSPEAPSPPTQQHPGWRY